MTPDDQARAIVDEWERNIKQNDFDTKSELEYLISSALRASRPTWTDERPTEPGWYWWKGEYQGEDPLQCVELFRAPNTGKLLVSFNSAFFTFMDDVSGQWARIELPEDQP